MGPAAFVIVRGDPARTRRKSIAPGYDEAGRTDIERQFSQLVCFGGGLATLPPWVRRIWRVRNWVMAKLLINAVRILAHNDLQRP